eukprot:1096083-Pelagomonas_calceolata.AAC.1
MGSFEEGDDEYMRHTDGCALFQQSRIQAANYPRAPNPTVLHFGLAGGMPSCYGYGFQVSLRPRQLLDCHV